MTIEKGCQTTTHETYPELEVTVAALSGGPIGPGDRYDTFNKTLIMATWYAMCCQYSLWCVNVSLTASDPLRKEGLVKMCTKSLVLPEFNQIAPLQI